MNLGIIPNVDKVSFIGDLGVGSRSASRKLTASTASDIDELAASGLEFELSAGISIPAGPIRIVPKTATRRRLVQLGDERRHARAAADIASDRSRTRTPFVFLGLAAYYSLDFGSKPATPRSSGPDVTASHPHEVVRDNEVQRITSR